jgi:hypothetical protein
VFGDMGTRVPFLGGVDVKCQYFSGEWRLALQTHGSPARTRPPNVREREITWSCTWCQRGGSVSPSASASAKGAAKGRSGSSATARPSTLWQLRRNPVRQPAASPASARAEGEAHWPAGPNGAPAPAVGREAIVDCAGRERSRDSGGFRGAHLNPPGVCFMQSARSVLRAVLLSWTP